MDLDIDEQQLVAEFRALSPAGRQELLKLATGLLRKCLEQPEPGSGDRCALKRSEQRPEAADEPISTE
ncbi:MAG TPA: hypothetical protein VIU41_15075 [Geobacteraceae bacterium]